MGDIAQTVDDPLAPYGDFKGIFDWAGMAHIEVYRRCPDRDEDELLGYVFVKKLVPKYPGEKLLWKNTAGHKETKEKRKGWDYDRTPLDTSVHEARSETGMEGLPVEAFSYVGKYLHWEKKHWKCLFVVRIFEDLLPHMYELHPDNEGVVPKFFTVAEFRQLVMRGEFMPEHYQKLVEFGLIDPVR